MTKFKVGDRVQWVYENGTPSGDIGTVTAVPKEHYYVNWDGIGSLPTRPSHLIAYTPPPPTSNKLHKACEELYNAYISIPSSIDYEGNGVPGSFIMAIIDALEEERR